MKTKYYILISVLGAAIDQILKYIFVNTPQLQERVFVNSNFAWGIPISNFITIALMAVVIIILLFFVFKTRQSALWIIIFGAFSNLFDRIYYNGVIDYIHTIFGSVINIADIMISVGVILIIFQIKKKK